jgi:hypothetical protein
MTTDIVERLREWVAAVYQYGARPGGEAIDLGAEAADEIERLRHELEGKISQSYAAELARQVGELEAENERLRELKDRPRDDGTAVAYGGEPGASAGKSE